MRYPHVLIGVIWAMASFALLGCAPYINSYYLPESQDGYRSAHSTLTSDAPAWILERGEATFYFSAFKDRTGYTIFALNIQPLHLPGETSLSEKARADARARVKPITVRLTDIQGGVSVSSQGATVKAELVRIVMGTYGNNNRHDIESLDSDLQLAVDQYLELSAVLKDADNGKLLVEWPTIVVNQNPVALPPIQFEWKRGVQVQFVNG